MHPTFQAPANPTPAGRRVRNLPPADTFIVQCFVDLSSSAFESEGEVTIHTEIGATSSSSAAQWKSALAPLTEVSGDKKRVALVRLPNDASVLELLTKVFPEAHDWSQQELEEAYVVSVACGDGTANSAFPPVFPLRTSATGGARDVQTPLGATPEKKRRSSSIAASELGTSFASAGSGGFAASPSPTRRGTNPPLPPALNRYPSLRQAMGLRFPYMVHVTTAAAFAQAHKDNTATSAPAVHVSGVFGDVRVSGSTGVTAVGTTGSELKSDTTNRLGVAATDGANQHRPASPNPVDPAAGKGTVSSGTSNTAQVVASDEKNSKQGETGANPKEATTISRAQLREMARRQKWIEKEQNEKRIAKREAALREIEEAKRKEEEEQRKYAKEREAERQRAKHEAELKRLTQEKVRQERIEAIEKEKAALRNRSLTAQQEARARFEELHNSTLQKIRDESRLSTGSVLMQGVNGERSSTPSFLPSVMTSGHQSFSMGGASSLNRSSSVPLLKEANTTALGAGNKTALPAPEEELSTGVRFNRERLLHSNRSTASKGGSSSFASTSGAEENLSKLIHALDVSTSNEAKYTEKLHEIEQKRSDNRDAEKLYLLLMEKAVTKKLQMKSQLRRTVAEQQISLVRAVEVDRKSAEAEEAQKNADESKRLEEYYASKRAVERKAAEIAAERTAYEEAVQRQVEALRQQKYEPPARIDNWVL